MGLFGKLFDKKDCAICGGEIGLLGNRKLADGNLCKNCASKLSPWMTDRRESTVEEIRAHLNYREQNARIVPTLQPNVVFGANTKVYIDQAARKFFVTSSTNWHQQNPDVIDINQVIDCRVDVKEDRSEVYRRDQQGHNVSYNPPRYKYEYRFLVTILVNSPYFSEIRFELTGYPRPDNIRALLYHEYEQQAYNLQCALDPAYYGSAAPAAAQPEAAPSLTPTADTWVCSKCGATSVGNFCGQCGAKRPVVYKCDKCGWVPADPYNPPKFCPNCGDPFNEDDAN